MQHALKNLVEGYFALKLKATLQLGIVSCWNVNRRQSQGSHEQSSNEYNAIKYISKIRSECSYTVTQFSCFFDEVWVNFICIISLLIN